MPTDIGNNGAPYSDVQVPLLTEDADIQAALRTYHYGSDTKDPGTLTKNSISWYLNNLNTSKINVDPVHVTASTDLNSSQLQSTGYYVFSGSGVSSPNLPKLNNVAYPGLLEVVVDGGVVFQTYHMIQYSANASAQINSKAWRANWDGWTSWKYLSEEGHVHDNRYYKKYDQSTVSDKSDVTYNAPAVDGFLATLRDDKIDGVNVNKITVSATAPVNPSDGDLWFW